MTEQSHHDQDADPPTPIGEEPDQGQLQPGSEPASDPVPILTQASPPPTPRRTHDDLRK